MCNSSIDPTKAIKKATHQVWDSTGGLAIKGAEAIVVDPIKKGAKEVGRHAKNLANSMAPDIPPPPGMPTAAEAPTMADSSVRGAYAKSQRRRASNSGTILTGPLGAGSGSGGTLLGGG